MMGSQVLLVEQLVDDLVAELVAVRTATGLSVVLVLATEDVEGEVLPDEVAHVNSFVLQVNLNQTDNQFCW